MRWVIGVILVKSGMRQVGLALGVGLLRYPRGGEQSFRLLCAFNRAEDTEQMCFKVGAWHNSTKAMLHIIKLCLGQHVQPRRQRHNFLAPTRLRGGLIVLSNKHLI